MCWKPRARKRTCFPPSRLRPAKTTTVPGRFIISRRDVSSCSGGGTGNPLFTTDTAAALRASETRCCALLKGTQVDGVYSADPKRDPNAKRYDTLSFNDVLSRELKVMDGAAIAIARDNKVPILVFSIHNPGSFADVVMGKGTFTTVG